MTAARLGIGFAPLERRVDVIVRAGVLADELGYEFVSVPEGWGLDPTLVLLEIGRSTERIKLMAGILSVWGRSAASIAMAAATLHHMTGGRFILGLGASTPALTEGLHDVGFTNPARRLKTVAVQVRALFGR